MLCSEAREGPVSPWSLGSVTLEEDARPDAGSMGYLTHAYRNTYRKFRNSDLTGHLLFLFANAGTLHRISPFSCVRPQVLALP